MPPNWDRVKGAFFRAVKGAEPRAVYGRIYAGEIISQSADLTEVDMKLDDPTVPGMSGLPLKVGVPGVLVKLKFGSGVVRGAVAFSNGDPAQAFALLLDAATVERVSLSVTTFLELGATGLNPITDGVLTGQSIDPFTSLPHWALGNASKVVLSKKEP